jgi:hypothetical protein
MKQTFDGMPTGPTSQSDAQVRLHLFHRSGAGTNGRIRYSFTRADNHRYPTTFRSQLADAPPASD